MHKLLHAPLTHTHTHTYTHETHPTSTDILNPTEHHTHARMHTQAPAPHLVPLPLPIQANDENVGVNAAGKKVRAGASREKDRQAIERVRASDHSSSSGIDEQDA